MFNIKKGITLSKIRGNYTGNVNSNPFISLDLLLLLMINEVWPPYSYMSTEPRAEQDWGKEMFCTCTHSQHTINS
jgi:hypothetical protein